MRQVWTGAALLAASLAWAGSATAADDPAPPPSYAKDVKPFLNKYCMNCHNDAKPRAGVSVETFGDLLKESKRPLVVPEKPDDSRIMQTLSGRGKPMPPRRAPQPKAEDVAKVRDWITSGAKDDTVVADDDKKKTTSDPGKDK